MAIVIGAATTVSFGSNTCVINANWGYNPNVQRLYCIGEWTPDDSRTFYRPTETLNLTIYAPGPTHDVLPTTSCSDANSIDASISPTVCGGISTGSLSGAWLVSSYSYTKEDAAMPGQESWSLTRWKNLNSTPPNNFVEPTYVMRGMSEGQATGNAGIVFVPGSTVQSSTGSVSANSLGRVDILESGVVTRIGGGSSAAGEIGQGSASMQYTPLYI